MKRSISLSYRSCLSLCVSLVVSVVCLEKGSVADDSIYVRPSPEIQTRSVVCCVCPFQSVSVTVDGRVVPATTKDVDGRTVVAFHREVGLDEGDEATIRFA